MKEKEDIKTEDIAAGEIQQENTSNKKSKMSKFSLVLMAIVGFVLIAGIATAAYTQVVLNSPDRIWKDAINNTKTGTNEASVLINETSFARGAVKGSLKAEAPISASVTVGGKWANKNATFESETNIAGVKLNSEIRVVENPDTAKTDLFLKIDGLGSVSGFSEMILPGLSTLLEQTDNNWYVIDSKDIERLSPIAGELDVTGINPEKYREDIDKFKNILNDFVLSADQAQSVINYEPVGREDFNGNNSYKYKLSVNKERTQELLVELQNLSRELDTSSLSRFNSLDESLSFDSLTDLDIDQDVTIEAWVDMNYRYFRNVRIYLDVKNEATQSYIDFGLDYNGDEELPFNINYVNVNNQINENVNLLLSASFNRLSKSINLQFDLDLIENGQPIKTTGSLTFTASDIDVNVETPQIYESLDTIVDSLGLSALGSENRGIENFSSSEFMFDDIEL